MKESRNSIEDVGKNLVEAINNSKTIKMLEELRENMLRLFDERIEKIRKEGGIIRRVHFPKIKLNWKYFLSIPFIYGMIIPSVFLHFFCQVYQQICFRLYGIPRVEAKEFFTYDRQLLDLLTPFQKLNCIYCSYVNNLFRFATEIGARTERYWCPIKYYKKIDSTHSQYDKFISESKSKEEFLKKWEELQDFSDINKSINK